MTARAKLDQAMTETELQDAVLELARTFGWLCHHDRPARTKHGWVTAVQGDPGFPDLVLARRGVVLFVELKREKEKPKPDQEVWLRALAFVGGPENYLYGETGELAASAPEHVAVVWKPSDLSSGLIKRVLR